MGVARCCRAGCSETRRCDRPAPKPSSQPTVGPPGKAWEEEPEGTGKQEAGAGGGILEEGRIQFFYRWADWGGQERAPQLAAEPALVAPGAWATPLPLPFALPCPALHHAPSPLTLGSAPRRVLGMQAQGGA